MPVPRGFHEIQIMITGHPEKQIPVVKVLTCDKCGALVMMYKSHAEFHKKRGD